MIRLHLVSFNIHRQTGLEFHGEFILIDGDSISLRTRVSSYSLISTGCSRWKAPMSAMRFLTSSRLALSIMAFWIRVALDFVLFSKLVRPCSAFYEISVCRPETLPAGSSPTSGFLQIPSRGGHPCLQLTLPATECVADFHRRVIAHTGHTKNTRTQNVRAG